MPSEDDEEMAASARERRQCLRDDSYDAMNGKKLEGYLVRCKETLLLELVTRRAWQRKLLSRRPPESRPLHASCNPKASGQLYMLER
jgi:hypothetical protein